MQITPGNRAVKKKCNAVFHGFVMIPAHTTGAEPR